MYSGYLTSHDNLSVFEFSDKSLPDDLWLKKLELINIYKSQKRVCKRFLGMARMERVYDFVERQTINLSFMPEIL